MAVNAPGIHQALADGRTAGAVPGLSRQPTIPQSARSMPGPPGRVAATQVRCVPVPGHGYQNCTVLIQAQREA